MFQAEAAKQSSPQAALDIDAQDLPSVLGRTTWTYKPLLARGHLSLLVAAPFTGKSVTGYRFALSEIGELPKRELLGEPGKLIGLPCGRTD